MLPERWFVLALCLTLRGLGLIRCAGLEQPMLFMDTRDVESVAGRAKPVANPVQPIPWLECPPENYSKGATVTATFPVLPSYDDDTSDQLEAKTYEVFVVIGRGGEPFLEDEDDAVGGDLIQVKRYTTSDFKTYSSPVIVLSLEKLKDKGWAVKSIDRDPAGKRYVLLASGYGGSHAFASDGPPTSKDAFKPTTGSLEKANFNDHDDTNLIYNRNAGVEEPWVNMQIMYEDVSITMPKTYSKKKYCDNLGDEYRRVVSVRTSKTGDKWTQDAGCLDSPQVDEHCKKFNLDGMVRPVEGVDPPELEFYRVRPFYMAGTSRLAGHALLYAPAPMQLGTVKGYGRQPPSCKSDGCCHGPHMYEEWWVGPNDGNPANMSQWRRPFYDVRAFPHDIWGMSQPVMYNNSHTWIDNGVVWGVPQFRIAGLHSASNGELVTNAFEMPADAMWMNAQARWKGGNHVGGCDEGCAAYIMVELLSAENNTPIHGYERQNCIMVNVDGLNIPLAWKKNSTATHGRMEETAGDGVERTGVELAGTMIKMKVYFRDATIYAIGSHSSLHSGNQSSLKG